ncbi:MAG: hypothetical protein C5B54_09880 [Acidobacteria bacterium]|nr:MAG: hypothetical protein C5B54_09880 [Acidobacteriota bacterium]
MVIPAYRLEAVEPLKTAAPPVIDGVLNDEVWKEAPVISEFYQRLPKEGAPPTERTEVRMAYTSTSLFIAFRAFDSHPASIIATVMQRDDFDVVQNDQFAFAIDSYNDGHSGYWFSTNPLGVRVDAQFDKEGDLWEDNWNGIWECKTQINSDGWTAEIEIPFSTLRFQNAAKNTMGINLYRRIIRTNESLFAPLIPLSYANGTPNVSIAAKYEFTGIHGGEQIYLKPYVLGGMTDSNTLSEDTQKNAGADLRYQILTSLTANVSVRTDFAETDVDERQINLTRFDLFFPEKRDFFLESAANFQFGIPGQTEVFFSRRIGLSEDASEAAPILIGSKLTGKVANTDIGILDVQTQDTATSFAENFAVIRLKQDIGQRSYFGGIFTNRAGGDLFHRSYGADLNLYVYRDIFLNAFASAVDSTQIRTSYGSSAFSISLARESERTSFLIAYRDIGKDFDPAIGFVEKADIRRSEGYLFVPFYLTSKTLLSITPKYELQYDEDHLGNLSSNFQQASIKFLFQSNDQVIGYVNRKEEFVPEPFAVFRSEMIPAGMYTSNRAGISIATKNGRWLSAGLEASGGDFYGGSRTEISPSVLWKLNSHITLSSDYLNDWIRLPESKFRIQLIRARARYSLNTHFSISSIAQYDNDSQKIGVNVRAGYLFREGTELFIAYNDIRDESLPFIPPDRSIAVKFTYLFRL